MAISAANSENVVVPNRLRALREERGLTRRQVAAALGVAESTVERWEMSKTRLPDERKIAIAELLGVSPSELMGWK